MQLRRRWQRGGIWGTVALVAVASFLTANVALAVPVDPKTAAANLDAATKATAPDVRDAILSNAPDPKTAISARDTYAAELWTEFSKLKLLGHKTPEVAINTAIVLAKMDTISSDAALKEMLADPNPAVRYWGAKGLTTIAPKLKVVGGGAVSGVVNALTNAMKKPETSGVVKKEIVNALGAYGIPQGLIESLKSLHLPWANALPDADSLAAATNALALLEPSVAGLKQEEKEALAEAAAQLAFSALDQERNAIKGGLVLPSTYHAAVGNLVDKAISILNKATGQTLSTAIGSKGADEMAFLLGDVIGSPTAGGGKLQKAMPKLKDWLPRNTTPPM